MTTLPVRAYTDKLSYERGQKLSLHVSAEAGDVSVRLIRLIDSDEEVRTLDKDVEWALAGSYAVSPQSTCFGSFMVGEPVGGAPTDAGEVSFGAFVWSADFACAPHQTLIAIDRGRLRLELHDGRLVVVRDDEVVAVVQDRLINSVWHFVTATIRDGRVSLIVEPSCDVRGLTATAEGTTAASSIDLSSSITVAGRNPHDVVRVEKAARGQAEGFFTGKIEAPFVAAGAIDVAAAAGFARLGQRVTEVPGLVLAAAWDFAHIPDMAPESVASLVTDQPDGLLVNGPARGVTGQSFTGKRLSFLERPEEYAAIHFHATDLTDAGWEKALEGTLPDELESGVYGLVVSNDSGSDTVPITVVPRPADPRKKVLFVLPTFTYLAYANEALFNGLDPSAMTDQEILLEESDQAHVGDPSFGLSMYDTHPDTSGVMFSSARRQIINMRRGYRMWLVGAGRSFSSDMYMVEWLTRRGIDADIITDHELHARGPEYLKPYATVISGSHPEYTSEEMLDTLTSYRDDGGSIMYLGGNGWYWVTGVYSSDPLVVEIRRGQAGIRCWESYPGEVTLFSTGDPGGLWRHRGRAPQILSGVGFAAQGWGRSEPYFRSELASDPEFDWVFDGVEDDPIGSYGEVMGGAAGDEIDRADHALGTPHHAAVLGSSKGHSNFYQRVIEEVLMNLPDHGGGEQDPEVHADIVYFRTPRGGEVFTTGSIAWSGALLHNDGDNGVSRMTENVIRTFVERRA